MKTRSIVLLLPVLLALPLLALAGTPTDTFTPTASATSTPTATPGEGSYVLNPTTFVSGSGGNEMTLAYSAGASAWPASGGLLTLLFPDGFDQPSSVNFYPLAADAAKVAAISYAGRSASVQLKNLAPAQSLTFRYGFNSTGFFVATTPSSASFMVWAHPQSTTLGAGGLLLLQPAIAIQSPTITPTVTPTNTVTQSFTITPTFSQTPSFTITPTFSVSPTFTITPTETPLGPVAVEGVYSYPNPFDLSKTDKTTFRFPPDMDAKITVFNLAGEPVRELPAGDINGAAGWAIWRGEDDYLRKATGGLYFVRVKGSKTYMRKFTVVR